MSNLTILGNNITHEVEKVTEQWAINKTIQFLKELKSLHLKRHQKNEVIGTNVLPLFTYIATTSKMPKIILKRLQMEITSFLFEYENFDYEKTIQRKEQGGLGTIDIPTMADMAYTKPIIEYLKRAEKQPEDDWHRRVEQQLAIILNRYRSHGLSNAMPHTPQPLRHWMEAQKTLQDMNFAKDDDKMKPKQRYRLTLDRKHTRYLKDMQGPHWENINHDALT